MADAILSKHYRGGALPAVTLLAAGLAGLVTGSLAGLLGVGGGEYRDALYLYLLKRIRLAIFANLVTGFLVVSVSFMLRGPGVLFQQELVPILAGFTVSTFAGAYLGAGAVRITNERSLRLFLAGLLIITAVWLVTHSEEPLLHPSGQLALLLSSVFGFGIGFISAFLGVAGGEYRIPVLILFFGLTPLTAATANALVSMVSTGLGVYRHYRFGHVGPTVWRPLIIVSCGSLLGAVIGTLGLLPHITGSVYVWTLSAVLVVVAGTIIVDVVRRYRRGSTSLS